MNGNTLRIEWDDHKLSEIEEAKALYQKARREGRKITTLEGTPIESFKSFYRGLLIQEIELQASEFAMRILDETGDRRLIWNALDPEQVKEASQIFQSYLDKGWKAYATDLDGRRKRRIHRFDPKTLELYFDETSTDEKLKGFISHFPSLKGKKPKKESLGEFVQSFKQMKLLPRTYPG